MALKAKSLFLYGFQITEDNRWIDFKTANAGPTYSAALTLGFYSLTELLAEIARAMNAADGTFLFVASANRSINGGLENRVGITTNSSFFSILFSTGMHASSSVALLIGFLIQDYTGATTYTGSSSAGTILVTEREGYNYLQKVLNQKVFGSTSVSASGLKEAIVFSVQRFIEVTFKYEPFFKCETEWATFMVWAVRQRPFDFTPEITSPTVFEPVTMETTEADGQALAFRMPEMIPDYPFFHSTGALKMRVRNL